MQDLAEGKNAGSKTATVAFRVPAHCKHLIRAAAARRGEVASDWLRRAAKIALAEEFGSRGIFGGDPTRGPTRRLL